MAGLSTTARIHEAAEITDVVGKPWLPRYPPLRTPELSSLMEILTSPPPPAQLNDYDLVLLPSVYVLSPSAPPFPLRPPARLPASLPGPALLKANGVPAVCHNDTITLSPPSSVSAFPVPAAAAISVCLISPYDMIVKESPPLRPRFSPFGFVNIPPSCLIAFPPPPSPPCLFTVFRLLASPPPPSTHLLWVTTLRLGCRCRFSSPGCFIVSDFVLSLFSLLLCCFGDRDVI